MSRIVYPGQKNPYGTSVDRQNLDPNEPVMEGSLYVRRLGQIDHDAEVVPKEYVDQYSFAPLASIFQPYVVGNYYGSNFGSCQTAVNSFPADLVPCGRMDLWFLDKEYAFDQVAIRVSTGATSAYYRAALYRVSEQDFRPTALLHTWGNFDGTASNTTRTIDISRLTLSGLYGMYVQREGGTSAGSLEAMSGALRQGDAPFGIGLNDLVLASNPNCTYAYQLTVSHGLVANAFPDPSLFTYERLIGDNTGAGLFLRRAA